MRRNITLEEMEIPSFQLLSEQLEREGFPVNHYHATLEGAIAHLDADGYVSGGDNFSQGVVPADFDTISADTWEANS